MEYKEYFGILQSSKSIMFTRKTPSQSSIGTAMSQGLDIRGSIPAREIIFSPPLRPDRPWSQSNLLLNRYRGQSGWDVKLTSHLHLVQRLRIVDLCFQGVVFEYFNLIPSRVRKYFTDCILAGFNIASWEAQTDISAIHCATHKLLLITWYHASQVAILTVLHAMFQRLQQPSRYLPRLINSIEYFLSFQTIP